MALYVLAYHFRFERTHLETAQELMCIINKEWFCVAVHGRFTVMLSQFTALILVKAGASLDSIITAYSLHQVAFFHLLSIACLALGSWRAAIIQVAIPVAAIGTSYFMWPFAELLYGLGIVLTAWALWRGVPTMHRWKKIAIGLLVFMVFASHPLAVIVLVLLVVLEQVSVNRQFFFRPLALLILYVIYRWCFSPFVPVTSTDEPMLLNETFGFMMAPKMFLDLWGLIVLMLLTLVVVEKSVIKIVLVLSAILMAGVAIQIAGHSVELYHAVVVVMALHVILQGQYMQIAGLKRASLLVGVFVLFNMGRTLKDSVVFTARKDLIKQLVKEARSANQPHSVLENARQLLPDDYILLSPSFRHETLLLSGISGDPVSIIDAANFSILCEDLGVEITSVDPAEGVEEVLNDCNITEAIFYFRCDAELNQTYFPLDAEGSYELLEPDLADWESVWIDSISGQFIPHLL